MAIATCHSIFLATQRVLSSRSQVRSDESWATKSGSGTVCVPVFTFPNKDNGNQGEPFRFRVVGSSEARCICYGDGARTVGDSGRGESICLEVRQPAQGNCRPGRFTRGRAIYVFRRRRA